MPTITRPARVTPAGALAVAMSAPGPLRHGASCALLREHSVTPHLTLEAAMSAALDPCHLGFTVKAADR
ncbi:unnamed protein product [[Actinomadura] parvosata subsp. kistnae]|uniref:Uncharacterized protein n=2 Tax=Nonomuraea TaxID=83681 RepID=A0A1V0A1P7_9ACTN|nr:MULTISPECIES: hypothetical protein [unclassified Nonomuraea]AQZ64146.1 hypothetical protein BKM31_24165 [Nonomuraea sp. ATCC 55076]NJP97949.1 hypothetical protein [Nonomuraea sp. FMUSA5-5]SPL87371.1 unnamed protein product [Actinomadura parvosata subsp. kistnae]